MRHIVADYLIIPVKSCRIDNVMSCLIKVLVMSSYGPLPVYNATLVLSLMIDELQLPYTPLFVYELCAFNGHSFDHS